MGLFLYKGRNKDGEIVIGEYEASTSTDAASHLLNVGITPIDIDAVSEKKNDDAIALLNSLVIEKKPDLNDLIMFSRQMATLLRAGISILPALNGLKTHMEHAGLSAAISGLANDLENGRSLAGSMQHFPKIFPPLFISMVNVGENTGRLDQAFLQIHQYLEIDKETQDQIKAATRYPTFVIVALVIAMVIINIFVIPSFSNVFAGFGSELPWATQILMGTSDFMVNHWKLLLALAALSIVGLKGYLKTERGLYKWDRIKLKIPFVGSIIERATLARFSRAFSMASRAGVPITQILSIVSRAVDNRFLERRIMGMRDGLEHGESLTQTAIVSNLFTPLVLQMISVGEETGAVDEMLMEVANFYEREVEFDTKRLSSAIEPILISVIGVIVLILALGIFLPMWDLGGAAMGR
ncbi:MAG: MSHA biogenesis protein MshG [Methylophagaceae bacterium]|jgi:MSHA biogenesis protein MshG